MVFAIERFDNVRSEITRDKNNNYLSTKEESIYVINWKRFTAVETSVLHEAEKCKISDRREMESELPVR